MDFTRKEGGMFWKCHGLNPGAHLGIKEPPVSRVFVQVLEGEIM